MKVKCEYCGNFFDDTLEKCPNCGAPNNSIRRSTADQPTTVEELKMWYVSNGLPPEDVTRFFIGVDYKEPKAFGIYKDENSGNFVVYKNKADGSRAVRYEGTDEAYAVNELYLRLKQEILQQKANNLKNASGSDSSGSNSSGTKGGKSGGKKNNLFLIICFLIFLSPVLFAGIFFMVGVGMAVNEPNEGYYQKDGIIYYHSTDSNGVWADYDASSGEWEQTEVAQELQKHRTAKNYYLGKDYQDNLGVSDFKQSILYDDITHENAKGYYKVEDRNYYFLPTSYGGWYSYDDGVGDWTPVSKSELPPDLQHYNTSQNFWYTPTWDSSTQMTDFENTSYYEQYEDRTSSSSDSDSSWDSNDSWDSGSTDWDSDW